MNKEWEAQSSRSFKTCAQLCVLIKNLQNFTCDRCMENSIYPKRIDVKTLLDVRLVISTVALSE